MNTRHFGPIPGIPVGATFANRLELSLSGMHPPTQAGISGSQQEGADSIVLSGKYEDDQDFGDVIIYTGHGSRDGETGKQVSDQLLVRQNLALAKNCLSGLPVRVIRRVALEESYLGRSVYRYDGLYFVDSYWREKGVSGYYVWRYKLMRLPATEQTPADVEEPELPYGNDRPTRTSTTTQRIVRDTAVGRSVKELYNFACQVCQQQLPTNAGYYAEAAHIQPLGAPHHGPDTPANVLCLCPNHHVMFDFGGFAISDTFDLLGLEGRLRVHPRHNIGLTYLDYHRTHFWE